MSSFVLGIETSCDETALSLLVFDGSDVKILQEEILSQVSLHKAYGGVVPELASREHMKALPLLAEGIFTKFGINTSDLSMIAVTAGPGLKGCLLMGTSFAQGLAFPEAVDLVGVNHIEGHILSLVLDNPDLKFPFLALIVSGGHTELIWVEGVGKYIVAGRTLDDAAGEAFDKSANLLGFSYPGGAKLAELADSVPKSRYCLPVAMRGEQDFSFSGLKTAVALLVKREERWKEEEKVRAELAKAIQTAIVESLVIKVEAYCRQYKIKRVGVAGGVSANKELRSRISRIEGINAFFPLKKHCSDNGSMIAYAGYMRKILGLNCYDDCIVRPQWRVEDL
ncbi:MAG: tRNA (adenosine(37)-N6)-threonylcarbamoyltransferase complex transferase subunit TsaD [Candidatus Dadabacteria bacterium]|nr:MAG: tRNA (adenosine(37)-N6)-threonylcarbamoyltransferase complex transferase subunit TsaD [Candidatus Dadabacteria bacterium]